MYGKGVRYSTIYQANRDQIRNARWIYPGQVFVAQAGIAVARHGAPRPLDIHYGAWLIPTDHQELQIDQLLRVAGAQFHAVVQQVLVVGHIVHPAEALVAQVQPRGRGVARLQGVAPGLQPAALDDHLPAGLRLRHPAHLRGAHAEHEGLRREPARGQLGEPVGQVGGRDALARRPLAGRVEAAHEVLEGRGLLASVELRHLPREVPQAERHGAGHLHGGRPGLVARPGRATEALRHPAEVAGLEQRQEGPHLLLRERELPLAVPDADAATEHHERAPLGPSRAHHLQPCLGEREPACQRLVEPLAQLPRAKVGGKGSLRAGPARRAGQRESSQERGKHCRSR